MAKILIIDDDNQFRKMLRLMLEKEGYEIAEASDGAMGIQIYQKEPADVVITDLIMDGKEGIETIRELRRDFPDVKIIAISGGGIIKSEYYLQIAGLLGVQRTFAKPFKNKEILEAVNELI